MENFQEGAVILIDKSLHWTSFDVVKKIRYSLQHLLKVKRLKVGHAGTLDPLATGLLIVCTGKKTKSIANIQAAEKEYTGTITLGATTPSYDLETATDCEYPIDHITEEAIHATTEQFLGEINQMPPIFSAKKVEGKRAYDRARKGEKPVMKVNLVTIKSFQIERIAMPEVDFRIVCSKGTYIRSVAHDFGQALNSGAHLSSLRRTRIGDYTIDQAKHIDSFLDEVSEG